MKKSTVIACINDVIECCKDSEYGFRTCAEHAHRTALKHIFNARASECRAAANELQELVYTQLGGMPEEDGSALGALHRGWVAVKAKLAGYNDLALLEECERGEDVTKESYLKALEQNLPHVVADVLQRQYEGVKRHHLQIRQLRDAERLAHA